jgi:peptidoglycan-associated lipoprotein
MKHLTSCTLALVSMVALVAGCESPSKVAGTTAVAGTGTAPIVSATRSATPTTGAAATGAPQSGVSTVNLANTRSGTAGAAAGAALMAAPAQRVVYFDFDSFVIKPEFQGLLDGHAKVLSRTNGKRMVIEGHTDERGGREYNLALGQKRAESVVKSLSLLGVPEAQLEAVSFGEERPAANGADESAWSRNRRAELKDR